jgi:hypothetical protein
MALNESDTTLAERGVLARAPASPSQPNPTAKAPDSARELVGMPEEGKAKLEGGGLQEAGRPKEDFDVQWDGDHDPMDPRNMGTARKWMVVVILSTSSLCV